MMQTKKTWIKWIQERISVRTYEEKEIETQIFNQLNEFIDDINKSCKAKIRFSIIQQDATTKQNHRLGTYGVISGTNTFIVGLMQKDERDFLEFGYQCEKIVLYATGIGLGTCWLGGTFNRKDFETFIKLEENESLSVLIALGYKKDRKSLIEAAMRTMAKSEHRKESSELFFNEVSTKSLSIEDMGKYKEVFELVRIGPSASNKQPWRIVKSGSYFQFYLCRTPGYGLTNFDLQLNDIGIAKCHFELSSKELGLKGSWIKQSNTPEIGSWEYIDSWLIKD